MICMVAATAGAEPDGKVRGRRKPSTDHSSRFFSHVPDLMCVVSRDGRFLTLNEAWSALGYSREELVSRALADFLHPDDVEPTLREIQRRVPGDGRDSFVNRYRAADGTYRWIEWKSMPAEDGLLYAIGRDITGYLEKENSLTELVDRNRILMRELHHRTKNNLAVVSSLLALAAEDIGDGDHHEEKSRATPRATLLDARSRIQVVTAACELMQRVEEASSVELGEYFTMLAESIFQSCNTYGDALRLEVTVENALVCSKTAIPVGLILNELMINALKHAYREGTGGTIRVVFRTETVHTRRDAILQVIDDGKATPADGDRHAPDKNRDIPGCGGSETGGSKGGMGIMLIRSLVDQVNGVLLTDRDAGTAVTLRFPLPADADRQR